MFIEEHTRCLIRRGEVILNGTVTYRNPEKEGEQFLKDLYHHLSLDYSRFFKMDSLSKLALLTAELVVEACPENLGGPETGVLFANRSSSLATDWKYQQTISEGTDKIPSPATFVYTLPNIMIGEVCKRHQIKGESLMFIMDHYDEQLLNLYAEVLLENKFINKVLVAWVEYTPNGYEAIARIISSIITPGNSGIDAMGLNLPKPTVQE